MIRRWHYVDGSLRKAMETTLREGSNGKQKRTNYQFQEDGVHVCRQKRQPEMWVTHWGRQNLAFTEIELFE